MPEGDTLHNLVRAIAPRLRGQPIEVLRLRDRGEIAAARGLRIEEVEAVGKHLLVLVERRYTLHVHLGLRGAFRIYDPAAAWQAAAARSTVLVAVPGTVLAIFRSAVHELRPYRDMRLEQQLRRLGPDLLAPELDPATVLARARAPGHHDLAVTDLLLDQTVAAGIGNVYRSEVLFLCGLYPWARVGTLDDTTLQGLFERARALMRSNLGPWRRATVGPHRGARRPPDSPLLWVYGREGLPCLRCRTPIRRSIEGRQARSTYWCPRCQPPRDTDAHGRPPGQGP
jgi:endonuclease-8